MYLPIHLLIQNIGSHQPDMDTSSLSNKKDGWCITWQGWVILEASDGMYVCMYVCVFIYMSQTEIWPCWDGWIFL